MIHAFINNLENFIKRSITPYSLSRKPAETAPMRMTLMENENMVAIISMIIDNEDVVPKVNSLLHEYGRFILSRMGLPYRERSLNIISVVVDAPADKISALSGKLGRLPGVTSKAVYSSQKAQTAKKTKEG